MELPALTLQLLSQTLLPALVWWFLLQGSLRHFPHTPFYRRLPLRMRGVDLLLVAMVWFVVMQLHATASKWLASGPPVQFALLAASNTLLTVGIPWLLYALADVPPYQLGIHRSRWKQSVAFGVLQAAAWGPLCAVANMIVRIQVPQQVPHPVQRFIEGSHPIGEWLLVTYCVVIAAPLFEELLFRGILQGFLSRRLPVPVAVGVTATLFGFAHAATWPDPLPLIVLSVGLGIAYQRTRSLWAPVAMHATFNGCMLAFGALSGH